MMATGMAARASYLAQLRRAFLLRAHPDRFRLQSPEIRKQQATLLQAITTRFASPDFVNYTSSNQNHHGAPPLQRPELPYVLEQRDGTLSRHLLDLNESVETILESMNAALTSSGHNSPGPPPRRPSPELSGQQVTDDITWISTDDNRNKKTTINRSYDIHSNHGRDLREFLTSLDSTVIQQRAQDRLHVTAVASVLRRDYQFSSVDGIGLGWSSSSFAVLLRSLADLYHEHNNKFRVSTFYPLRIVWSSEDYSEALDVFGGQLYLNPASTPTQILDHLLSVTPELIERHKKLRTELQIVCRQAQSHLGVTFRKGHSCSSREYHDFMMQLAASLPPPLPVEEGLALERIFCVVESPQAARRAKLLSQNASIQVGAAMSNEKVSASIQRLLPKARHQLEEVKNERLVLKQAIDNAKTELGLHRVHYSNLIQRIKVTEALQRLVQRKDIKKDVLAGNVLGLVPTGRRCHVGDDGSILIPWDWN